MNSFPRTMQRLKKIQRGKKVARHDAVRAGIEQIYLAGIGKVLARARVQVLHKLNFGKAKASESAGADASFANADPVAADFMFDLDDFTKMFFAEMREAGIDALEISGQGLLSELGIDRKYVTPQGLIHDFTIERENKLSQVPSEVYDTVKSALEDGVQEGMTMGEMADRVVNDTFGKIDKGRAMTIARTETASAYNTGRMDGMKRHGITHKSWLDADDDKVRTTHGIAHAEGAIPIDQKFSNGLRYPGDPDGSAAEVCNCRCTLEAEEAP